MLDIRKNKLYSLKIEEHLKDDDDADIALKNSIITYSCTQQVLIMMTILAQGFKDITIPIRKSVQKRH
jgi:hypothetical protein